MSEIELSDQDAEHALLGCVLRDPILFDDLSETLTPDMIALQSCRLVWKAIGNLLHVGTSVDPITIADLLRKSDKLDVIGGSAFLDGLLDEPATALASEYAAIVIDRYQVRRAVQAASTVRAAALDPAATGQSVTQTVEDILTGLTDTESKSLQSVSKYVPKTVLDLAQIRKDGLLGYSTGFARLDELVAGMQPGQLIIPAARPGMGKTVLLMQLALAVARASEGAVVFASYEMTNEDLFARALACESGVGLGQLRSGLVPREAEATVLETAQNLPKNLLFDDHPPTTPQGLRSLVRRESRKTGISALFVDYLQLMSGSNPRQQRFEQVSEISRALKLMAKDLEIPVIAAAQLNRSLEARDDKRPKLADLRDSGSLEQDADTVWFIYRDVVYNQQSDPASAEIIVSKQRSGPQGSVALRWNGNCTRFENPPPPEAYYDQQAAEEMGF